MKVDEEAYKSYEHEKYVHYFKVKTGEVVEKPQRRGEKVITIKDPVTEEREIAFDDLKSLSLDSKGVTIPSYEESYFLVHNYFMDFWGAIMGTDAVVLYLHLKRRAYGKKDFCFPDMKTLRQKMKASKNTVIKNISILEQHGFILRVWRRNLENHKKDSSPFFKIRRYIPMLSEDLIEQLPEKVREEHDEYLAELENVELSLDKKVDSSEIKDRILSKSKIIRSNNTDKERKKMLALGQYTEYITANLDQEQAEEWASISSRLSELIAKPSYDTWILNSIGIVEKDFNKLTLATNSGFASEHIKKSLKEYVVKAFKDVTGVELENFVIITNSDYIKTE